MDPAEWFDKRRQMADAFGIDPSEVLPEAVWYLAWPQPPITAQMIDHAKALAGKLQLNAAQASDGGGA